MRAILCHSDNLFDTSQYEEVFIPISILKAEVGQWDDAYDIINKAGTSWSYQVMNKFPNSRWITMRGSHVLIVPAKKGKKARIVFAPDAAMEHLVVYGKDSKEYADIKAKAEKRRKEREAQNKKVEVKMTPEQKAELKELKKQRLEETRAVKQRALDYIKEKTNLKEEELAVGAYKELFQGLSKKVDRKIDKEKKKAAKEAVEKKNEDLAELMEAVDGESELVKNQVLEALKTKSDEAIIKKTFEEIDPSETELGKLPEPPVTGVEKVDKAIKRLTLDKEEAFEIARTLKTYKKELKDIRDRYKDDNIFVNKQNLEVTNLQGLFIDDGESHIPDDELIKDAVERQMAFMRAEKNSEFYKRFEQRKGMNSLIKQEDSGAIDTINGIANIMLEGKSVSADLVRFVGNENASRMVAGAIAEKLGVKEGRKQLEEFLRLRGEEVVGKAIETIKDKEERIKAYEEMTDEGVYKAGSLIMAMSKQKQQVNEELGRALGSLESAAIIVDSMKDIEESKGDIIVDGGKNLESLNKSLKHIGLKEENYSLKKVDGRWQVTIPYENFGDSMETVNKVSAERDREVAYIKKGFNRLPNGDIDPTDKRLDWLPKGTSREFYQLKTEGQISKMSDAEKSGWERFKNVKGEKGYSSEAGEGNIMYRKVGKFRMNESQWKMINMAMSQKRFIANLGAGTGKTLGFLGITQELKGSGKLKSFHFHTMPSRLLKEFLNDQQMFFPNLKVISTYQKSVKEKTRILADAERGKYDIVIDGHDSMKKKYSGAAKHTYVEEKKRKVIEERAAKGLKTTPSFWNLGGEGFLMSQKWTDESNELTIPKLISSFNPQVVTVDEAHEAFKDPNKTTSQRSEAVKELAKNAEYFVPATGTVIKNSVGELASMLSVTRPDLFPSATKFSSQYKNINQGATLFEELGTEAFRQTYDNAMLTQELKVVDKTGKGVVKKEFKRKIQITPEQKKLMKAAEDTYHAEKTMSGYAIMNSENYSLVNNAATFQDISFKTVDKDGKPTTAAKKFVKEKGLDPEKFEIVKLGQRGAAARRNSRESAILNSGDWKTNAKMQSIFKDYEKHNQAGDKQIIFYKSRSALKMLQQAFKEKYGYKDNKDMFYIDGQVKMHGKAPVEGTDAGRGWKKKEFNGSADAKVIFCSEAGMTGLNLQQANVAHYLELPDTYSLVQQGNARVFRTGQGKDVNIYYHNTNTLIDDRKLDILSRKKKTTDAIKETSEERVSIKTETEAAKKRYEKRKKQLSKAIKLIMRL